LLCTSASGQLACTSPHKNCQYFSSLHCNRKSHLCIPFMGIARPQSQFPHLCICEQYIYSQDRSTYFLQQNRRIIRGNICVNWDCASATPFLGIFVSNFRYRFFAISIKKNSRHLSILMIKFAKKSFSKFENYSCKKQF
jgi:hypothetical protein